MSVIIEERSLDVIEEVYVSCDKCDSDLDTGKITLLPSGVSLSK